MKRYYLILLVPTLFFISFSELKSQTRILRTGEVLAGDEILYSMNEMFYAMIERHEYHAQLVIRDVFENRLVWGIRYSATDMKLGIRNRKLCIEHISQSTPNWCANAYGTHIRLSDEGQILFYSEDDLVWSSPKLIYIDGRVIDEKGQPIEGVDISCAEVDNKIMGGNSICKTISTDANGNYGIYAIEGTELLYESYQYEEAREIVYDSGKRRDVQLVTMNSEDSFVGKKGNGQFFSKLKEGILPGYYKDIEGEFSPYTTENEYLLPTGGFQDLPYLQSGVGKPALLMIPKADKTDFLDETYIIKSGSFAYTLASSPNDIEKIAIRFTPTQNGKYVFKWESILLVDQDVTVPLIIRGKANDDRIDQAKSIVAQKVNTDELSYDIKLGEYLDFVIDIEATDDEFKPVAIFYLDVKSEAETDDTQLKKIVSNITRTAKVISETSYLQMKEEFQLETINNISFGAFLGGLSQDYEMATAVSLSDEHEGLYALDCSGMANIVLLVKKDDNPQLIKNQEELRSFFAPIETFEEAFSFVHLQEGGLPPSIMADEIPKGLSIAPKMVDNSYQVSLIVSDPCDLHGEINLITYLIDREGNVEKIASKSLD